MNEKIETLLFLGELLMRSGAAAERIKRDLLRAAVAFDIPEDKVILHITYMTIMLNVKTEEKSYTAFRKCPTHGVNMTVIDALSKLTWVAIKEKLPLSTFKSALERIEREAAHPMRNWEIIMAGLTCGGICRIFGGDWSSLLITAIAASIACIARNTLGKYKYNNFATVAISAFIATALALILPNYIPTETPAYPMIAVTLFLIPGVQFIHSVDDLLNHFVMTGTARLIHAILIVGSMTFGLTLALAFFNVQDFTKISITPESLYLSQTFGAAIAGAGYASLFRVPKRLIPLIALGGIIAVDSRNIILVQFGGSLPLATFIGACILGIIAQKANQWFKTPSTVFTIPSAITLMPGVLIYRFLFAMQNITTIDTDLLLTGLRSGVEAGTVVIAIAVAVTIPTILFRPILDELRSREIILKKQE